MPEDERERRRSPRLARQLEVAFYPLGRPETRAAGVLRDVSSVGVFVESSAPPPLGAPVALDAFADDLPRLEAEVVRVEHAHDGPRPERRAVGWAAAFEPGQRALGAWLARAPSPPAEPVPEVPTLPWERVGDDA